MNISLITIVSTICAAYASFHAYMVMRKLMKLNDDWCCPNLDNDGIIKTLLGLFVVNFFQFMLSFKWIVNPIHLTDNFDYQSIAFFNLSLSFISYYFSSFIEKLLSVRTCHNTMILAGKYKTLELMANSIGTMLWAKSVNDRLLFANRAACDNLFHGDPKSIINKTGAEITKIATEALETYTIGSLLSLIEAELTKHRSAMRFVMIGCASTRGLWVALDVTPSFDIHGNYIGYVGMGRNVTHKCDDVSDCIQLMIDTGRVKPIRDDLYFVVDSPLDSDCESAIDSFRAQTCKVGG